MTCPIDVLGACGEDLLFHDTGGLARRHEARDAQGCQQEHLGPLCQAGARVWDAHAASVRLMDGDPAAGWSGEVVFWMRLVGSTPHHWVVSHWLVWKILVPIYTAFSLRYCCPDPRAAVDQWEATSCQKWPDYRRKLFIEANPPFSTKDKTGDRY